MRPARGGRQQHISLTRGLLLLLLGWLESPKYLPPETSTLSHHHLPWHVRYFGQPQIAEAGVPKTCALLNVTSI